MIRRLTLCTGAITLAYLAACGLFELYNSIEGRRIARKAQA